MTTAKRVGVSIGTAIWRGLRAGSAIRRRASGSSAPTARTRGGRARVTGAGSATEVAMGRSFRGRGSGGLRHAVAGEAQVDVVERRRAGGDPRRAQIGRADRRDGLSG